MSYDNYQNPLISRYSSQQMSELWGDRRKFETWRRLWIALAEAESEMGLDVSSEQVEQMRGQIENIDFARGILEIGPHAL